jgi:hypothetical protein
MRIAIIAPPSVPVPPTGYAGTEAIIDELAPCHARAGHEVVLFTTGDSTCGVLRRTVADRWRVTSTGPGCQRCHPGPARQASGLSRMRESGT